MPELATHLSWADKVGKEQLPDVYGRPLDGNDDGQPGGDFVALLTKSGVKIESFAHLWS